MKPSADDCPARVAHSRAGRVARPKVNPSRFGWHSYTVQAQQGDDEIVFGLIGKFSRLDYGQPPFTTAARFLAFDQPDFAKLTVGLQLQHQDDHRIRLATETRFNAAAVTEFSPYWYLIQPVSGLPHKKLVVHST